MATKTWEEGIIKGALRELHTEWGVGWSELGERLRGALLAEKVLSVIAHQDTEGNSPEQMARAFSRVIHLAHLATTPLLGGE